MQDTTTNLPPCPPVPGFPRRRPTSPQVQEAFQFLLATAMHEAGKFERVSVAEVEGRWPYTFSGAGEVFSAVRPEMRERGHGKHAV